MENLEQLSVLVGIVDRIKNKLPPNAYDVADLVIALGLQKYFPEVKETQ